MGDQGIFYITTVSAFIALFATIFQGYFSSNELQHVTLILSSLTELEFSNVSVPADIPRVAVGYGACTDVYLNAAQFLNASHFEFEGSLEEVAPSDKITSERELLQTFAYFFSKGAAAE